MDVDTGILDDLAAASRILVHQGVFDAAGHVSVRHPRQADRFLMPRSLAPALVTRHDIIELTIDGTMARTLIRELQRHPVKRDILHVDFQELVAGEKVTIRVPLKFVGTPEGVRTGGGILDETVRELHISVDPAEIPNHIDIDVSHLQVGKSLHVRDVKAPAGVTILDDPAGTICVCMIPKEVATPTPEEAAAAGAAPAEPELIRKPKAEDEEGAEGEEKK